MCCVFCNYVSNLYGLFVNTQMKWRLREGQGEALYEIGVEDNGILTGLSSNDMKDSLSTLHRMATVLGAVTTILRERKLENGRIVAEVLVRKVIQRIYLL